MANCPEALLLLHKITQEVIPSKTIFEIQVTWEVTQIKQDL